MNAATDLQNLILSLIFGIIFLVMCLLVYGRQSAINKRREAQKQTRRTVRQINFRELRKQTSKN
jgi:hypothetical protein